MEFPYALNAAERRSAVFVPDLGEPIRIIDLARRLIKIMRPSAGHEVLIMITGLKPGEKLREELFNRFGGHSGGVVALSQVRRHLGRR